MMQNGDHEDKVERQLSRRVPAHALRQRLRLEQGYKPHLFRQGRTFFHPENWYSLPSIIRVVLKASGLYTRGQRNAVDLQIRHHHIKMMGLPPTFNGFTLLHLSDLHLDLHPHLTQSLIQHLQGITYDVVVLTGDFRGQTFGPHAAAMAEMSRLQSSLQAPIYGVLGNHDTIRMVPALEAMGIRILLNETVRLSRGRETIYLSGIDDPHYYKADNLDKACASIPPEAVSILLSHSPEIYCRANHLGFSLMLCGHTHGGQICLPGGWAFTYNAKCPRKLCAGAWHYQRLLGYTSVGVGASVVDVRFNCQPEITLHHLHMVE